MGSLSPTLDTDSRVLVSADGTEIYANAVGSTSKPAIVFIHGFSLSSLVFDAVFSDPAWVSQFYLVRYDMRGHGRSGKPVDEPSWESKRLAEDFDAVAQGFMLTRPFVVGWSLGATNIADILSFNPPSYLSGIIYVTALPYMGPVMHKVASPKALACILPLTQTSDVGAYQDTAQQFISMCSNSLPHALRLACLGDCMVQPRAVTNLVLARTQDERGLRSAGQESGLPLLIINSGKDEIIVGDEVVNAVDGWKDLSVVVMDGADHMPWVGYPDRFRQEILDWIKKNLRLP